MDGGLQINKRGNGLLTNKNFKEQNIPQKKDQQAFRSLIKAYHETLLDTEVFVNDLGKRSKAVSGARSIGNDGMVGRFILLVVDTNNKHGSISRRSRDDDLLGTTLKMGGGLIDGGEDTSRFTDVVGTDLTPRNFFSIHLGETFDILAVDTETISGVLNGTVEATVNGIVVQHVGSVLFVETRRRMGGRVVNG
jgi:hypothetical protein